MGSIIQEPHHPFIIACPVLWQHFLSTFAFSRQPSLKFPDAEHSLLPQGPELVTSGGGVIIPPTTNSNGVFAMTDE